MMKKIGLYITLSLAIEAGATSMSHPSELEGFVVPTKRSQPQQIAIQETSIPDTSTAPEEAEETPAKKPTLNARAHPKHRAGLHK